MKKILHIQVSPKLSGAQMISLEIMRSLPNSSYEKWILFSNTEDCGNKDECVRQFESAGAHVIFSKKIKRKICFSDVFAMIEIYRLCKKEKFDIVHTHSTKPGVIGRIAATLAGIPLVIHTVHGLAFHKFVRFPLWHFYWACEMFASLFCHKIVLVNTYYKKYFTLFGRKVITIYNGIDFSVLPPVHIHHSSEYELGILFVGRLDLPKSPLTLLHAAQIIIKKYPKVHFTLVGDGEKYDECKTYIDTENLWGYITLAGWQSNVTSYYQTHDVFVLPSIYESFGLVFLEAGFYKLPSVATNVEGIPEVVVNNQTGLLCNPCEPQALAEKILYLIEHPDVRQQLGENAHQWVTNHFSKQSMVESYKNVY